MVFHGWAMRVPSVAAVIDDVVVAFEDAVR
jgi:hypothetical protein